MRTSAATHSPERLLRHIAQIHRNIKDRSLGCPKRLCGQQQPALADVIAQRLMHHGAEHPLEVPF
ncbi:hypothetical protein UA70_21820 [Raoultella planticola]|nr:hypothetical protein UA70_21820 [Raoultella planticola]